MDFIRKAYPLNRTLVSDDTDQMLELIQTHLPGRFRPFYSIIRVPSGTSCWTWTAPKKYVVHEAYLEDGSGRRIIDVNNHHLHLASYSQPVDAILTFNELEPHLHFSEQNPEAIPWKYLFYQQNWGFCLSKKQFDSLDKNQSYHAVIRSAFEDDALKIGELVLRGRSETEALVITDICHPMQVNDSITGVSAVLDLLHQWQEKPNLTFRFLFLPETIGSLCYFAAREKIAQNIRWAIFTEMLGNDNSLALQYSFQGDTYIDKMAESVLSEIDPSLRTGPFRSFAGNDELVTNGPGLGIPTISITRSKKAFDCFPGYHTSDDTPDNLDPGKLAEGAEALHRLLKRIDADYRPKRLFKGPLFLSGCGLWGVWGGLENGKEVVDQIMLRMEGNLSVAEIALIIHQPFDVVKSITDAFVDKGFAERMDL